MNCGGSGHLDVLSICSMMLWAFNVDLAMKDALSQGSTDASSPSGDAVKRDPVLDLFADALARAWQDGIVPVADRQLGSDQPNSRTTATLKTNVSFHVGDKDCRNPPPP